MLDWPARMKTLIGFERSAAPALKQAIKMSLWMSFMRGVFTTLWLVINLRVFTREGQF